MGDMVCQREMDVKIASVCQGKDVAVLIPCYNEAVTIAKVIDDFRKELPFATIYVYDNNSTDGTGDIARSRGAVVRIESRQGKGNVVRRMFRDVDAEYYVMVDGDDTYPADSVGALLRPLAADAADMTVGDRLSNGSYKKENDRPFHGFGNNLVHRLISMIYGFSFKDVMTGYRAFTREFVKTMPVISEGFQIETEISIWAVDRRWRILDVPIDYRDRPKGSQSKLSTFTDGMLVIAAIISLFRDYRPMSFFGWLALVFALLGLCMGLPVVGEYFATGFVERFPSAILAVAFMIVAALALMAGLILETVAHAHRSRWELDVYRVQK